ncbi:MAG: 2,3-diphosphoglycerate synthetase [Actinobacteria bacterium]|nr:2,3-diphosphoglycerate synthetase [Actinomycetota bacterium]
MTRALALIDGEHYAPVIRDALEALPYDFAAALMLGGTEKLHGGEDYGVPVVRNLDAALAELQPDAVVDLSDEPVLGPRDRLALASRVLAHGVPYIGADFRFDPPPLEPFRLPSLGIVGTGKRVGKTTTTGYVARRLSETRDVVVVSMGRGGPPEPQVAEGSPTVEQLLELSRQGRHAASDYLEIAAVAGVATVGCRRCGGGMAGATFDSNVDAGAKLAAARGPDLVLFDGSGASLPPIATDRRILVVGAHQDAAVMTGYLNAYRILTSDLVVVTMAEEGTPWSELRDAIRAVKPGIDVVASVLRPRPAAPVAGRRVAFFTTAPEPIHDRQAEHLRAEHGAEVVLVSGNLSRRDALGQDLERAGDADVFVTEIKGAAIDVVAEAGAERGIDVVFSDNDLLPLRDQPDLDEILEQLAVTATQLKTVRR